MSISAIKNSIPLISEELGSLIEIEVWEWYILFLCQSKC